MTAFFAFMAYLVTYLLCRLFDVLFARVWPDKQPNETADIVFNVGLALVSAMIVISGK